MPKVQGGLLIMNVIILGSGTGIPLAHRASPALVMTSPDGPVLFDMGPGTLGRLARMGIRHERIGRVFFTHFHPDHTGDLVHFLFATRNPQVLTKREPFTVHAPRGFKIFLKGLEEAYGEWIRLPDGIMGIEELDPFNKNRIAWRGFEVLSHPVPHTSQSLAFRVRSSSSGRSFTYTGDTGFAPEVAAFARHCDVLISECSFPEGAGVEGHMTPSEAGRLATLAEAKKLVLIHFYPQVLATDIVSQCRKTFKGELVLGRDFLHLSV
jgi:ribonuclease BN (tRNA processing enzyme)